MNHSSRKKSFKLSPDKTGELEFLILYAADINLGVGCENNYEFAMKIFASDVVAVDNKTFAATVDEIFDHDHGVPSHIRQAIIRDEISDMIARDILFTDGRGIYTCNGVLVESSA